MALSAEPVAPSLRYSGAATQHVSPLASRSAPRRCSRRLSPCRPSRARASWHPWAPPTKTCAAPSRGYWPRMTRRASFSRRRRRPRPRPSSHPTSSADGLVRISRVPLGVGGGRSGKARDTRLDRSVAIKVLPASIAQDGNARTIRARSPRHRRDQPSAHLRAARRRSRRRPRLPGHGAPAGRDAFGAPRPRRAAGRAGPRLRHPDREALAAAPRDRHPAPRHQTLEPDRDRRRSRESLLDFGLAKPTLVPKRSRRAAELHGPGIVVGTLATCPRTGARRNSGRAHRFVLAGAVVAELATGRQAFPRAFDWTRPPAAEARRDSSRQSTSSCSNKTRRRYQTATALVEDLTKLQQATGNKGSQARRPVWAAAPRSRSSRRSQRWQCSPCGSSRDRRESR